MTDFATALQEKISALETERDELEEELETVRARLEVLVDLFAEETGNKPVASGTKKTQRTSKRKPGRPKGSKNKKPPKQPTEEEQALWREAQALGGTDPEKAKAIASRYRPVSRPQEGYGGVKVGSVKGNPNQQTQSNKTISIEDSVSEEGE